MRDMVVAPGSTFSGAAADQTTSPRSTITTVISFSPTYNPIRFMEFSQPDSRARYTRPPRGAYQSQLLDHTD